MDNIIKDKYQLNSILDIYGGRENNQTVNSAAQYYINHNSILNGVELSDKIIPINGIHKISNSYYYVEDNDYDSNMGSNNLFNKFYPILSTYDTNYNENNYKLMSAKDIDFENAYLKYAQPSYDYDEPISYYQLSIDENSNLEIEECTTGYTYSFGRGVTSYINHTYDLLNTIDYLLNRVNCLNFLISVIKEQKNIAN